jgi:hypothetical protein
MSTENRNAIVQNIKHFLSQLTPYVRRSDILEGTYPRMDTSLEELE